MAYYTYTANQDRNDRTGKIILRGGSLVIFPGQYADLTADEYAALVQKFVLTPGQTGLPAGPSEPGLYDLLSRVAVDELLGLVRSGNAGTVAQRDDYIANLTSGDVWAWTLLDANGNLIDIQSGKKA